MLPPLASEKDLFLLRTLSSSSAVAALIGDMVITFLGPYPPIFEYWKRIREIYDEYEVLMIVEELITAYGRVAGEHFVTLSTRSRLP